MRVSTGTCPACPELWDRSQIQDVLHEYARALDDNDAEALVACFAPGAHLNYMAGKFILDGLEEVRRYFSKRSGLVALGFSSSVSSTHLMSSALICVDGDSATSQSSAVAFLSGSIDGSAVLMHRGLRYVDEFRRIEDDWRIARRQHQVVWSFTTGPGGLMQR
jgi:ketosteroid isomerase-like protein